MTYAYGPDSFATAGAPAGTIERARFDRSVRYPGKSRTVWVHRPTGHRLMDESAVMVFDDGWWYLDPDGDVRAGIVLDNLAAAGAIPPMIAVVVDPGVLDADTAPQKNRNAEYDAFDDRSAGFLLEEVLPAVADRVRLSDAPGRWGICGGVVVGMPPSPPRGHALTVSGGSSGSTRASRRCPAASRTLASSVRVRARRYKGSCRLPIGT